MKISLLNLFIEDQPLQHHSIVNPLIEITSIILHWMQQNMIITKCTEQWHFLCVTIISIGTQVIKEHLREQ
jgi:hypothetical protein